TTEGNEVGISILDNALYQIEAPNQAYNIVDGNGAIGGGASIIVELENTVPIAMAVLKISNEPQVLIPSDEPFEDLNENGIFDDGENFIDWNGNNVWSPMIEVLSLSEDWDITTDPNDGEITVGITNWQEPLEPDSRQLFRINYSVGEEASLNDIISVTSESMLILDAWGNNGAVTTHNEGTVTINDVLSNSTSNSIPTHFSIDRIFPNPFNPITKISFSVPLNGEDIKISIYNILGSLQTELFNGTLESGRHSIDWDASKKSSGIYFIELKTDQFREIKKVTLIK
ncbi:MAG: T9SS type A sorting domain-containing protein, partial [Candidatus Neomarinimicrobiota bacterium]